MQRLCQPDYVDCFKNTDKPEPNDSDDMVNGHLGPWLRSCASQWRLYHRIKPVDKKHSTTYYWLRDIFYDIF